MPQEPVQGQPPPKDRFETYLSTLSVRRSLRDGRVTREDLPALAARLGFSGVEVSDRVLDPQDTNALNAFAGRLKEARVRLILDLNGDLTQPGPQRDRYIERIGAAIRRARDLSMDRVRVVLGGQTLSMQKLWERRAPGPIPEDESAEPSRRGLAQGLVTSPAAEKFAHWLRCHTPAWTPGEHRKVQQAILGLKEVAPVAEAHEVDVAVENHWGISTLPQTLMHVIEAVGSERIGTCPDFNNFPRFVNRYFALSLLAPRARHVHAPFRSLTVDGRSGDIDYVRCFRILADFGYRGPVAVEYVGPGDELKGASIARKVVVKAARAAGLVPGYAGAPRLFKPARGS